MPSADSHYTICAPCGLLTQWSVSCHTRIFCVPLQMEFGSSVYRMWCFTDAGEFGKPVIPVSGTFQKGSPIEMQWASRGVPWLLSAHDRQIYGVQPYDEYRTLSCVADSSRSLPASYLPALHLLSAGHTCTSTHAFASGLLQAYIAVAPLPLATLPLRQGGYGLCLVFVSYYQTSPISSRALPGTQPVNQADAKRRAAY